MNFFRNSTWLAIPQGTNPFQSDLRVPRKPYERDQNKRDAVLKQSFRYDDVKNDKYDAIVIGSGIGGLSCAAILARAGKKVLVLEQHDQAGGCCHSFIEKGYEFDVGIHYVGGMAPQSLLRTIVDQISDGQIEWNKMEESYDVVSIGRDDRNRRYDVIGNVDKWRDYLKSKFPDEHKAIDSYLSLIKSHTVGFNIAQATLKMMPLAMAKMMIASNMSSFMCKTWSDSMKSTQEVVNGLTKNKDLRAIFTYCWPDYGCEPDRSNFSIHSMVMDHYLQCGAFYPVGGSSEIAYNIIPVIERSGGKVLVRARVRSIICDDKKRAIGVTVSKSSSTGVQHAIYAPLIISDAGVYNTFNYLLPPEVAEKSYYHDLVKDSSSGSSRKSSRDVRSQSSMSSMCVFLGLDKSGKELGLKAENIWAYCEDPVEETTRYLDAETAEKAMDMDAPFIFLSFPSEKDPNWALHPARENKSTVAIVSIARWDWFKAWEDKTARKRGDEYDSLKKTLGENLIEQACKLFPQIRDNIEYTEVGTPVSNKYYLNSGHGEIYGLDHNKERISPTMTAKLRPETDVSGLYLTGQDVSTCGFAGALVGGVVASATILKRNLFEDLGQLHGRLRKQDAEAAAPPS